MPEDEFAKSSLRLNASLYRLAAAHCDVAVACIDATEAVRGFGKVIQRAEEAEFLEIVLRYDEPLQPEPRPWKKSKRSY